MTIRGNGIVQQVLLLGNTLTTLTATKKMDWSQVGLEKACVKGQHRVTQNKAPVVSSSSSSTIKKRLKRNMLKERMMLIEDNVKQNADMKKKLTGSDSVPDNTKFKCVKNDLNCLNFSKKYGNCRGCKIFYNLTENADKIGGKYCEGVRWMNFVKAVGIAAASLQILKIMSKICYPDTC